MMRFWRCGWVGLVAVICPIQVARAAVTELSAEIRSSVTLFIHGEVDSTDESIETFGDSGLSLPIGTLANLDSLDEADEPVGRGIAAADFLDPTRLTPTRNPEEIGLEADCFSTTDDTSFAIVSTAVERRKVMFSASELGMSGAEQTIQSAVFPSGILFLWSLDEGRDLTGLEAEVSFVVTQILPGNANGDLEAEEIVLVDERVSLVGGPDGTVEENATDQILVSFGDLDILPSVSGANPDDLGAVAFSRVAIIPDLQVILYEYGVPVDQEFELKAEFSVRVSNLPGGTGVASVFGRELTEAAEIIQMGIPDSGAKAIVKGLNTAMKQRQSLARWPLFLNPSALMCGGLGFELLPLLSVPMLLAFGGKRRMLGGSRPRLWERRT